MLSLTIKNPFSKLARTIPGAAEYRIERTIIEAHQAAALPHPTRQIRVLSGRAWVSYLGQDAVLNEGQVLAVEPGQDWVVVTALEGKPVELELLP
jgi:quercetin dioxygenase-like cupin family protein